MAIVEFRKTGLIYYEKILTPAQLNIASITPLNLPIINNQYTYICIACQFQYLYLTGSNPYANLEIQLKDPGASYYYFTTGNIGVYGTLNLNMTINPNTGTAPENYTPANTFNLIGSGSSGVGDYNSLFTAQFLKIKLY
jgi:hypothetical protein